jgi:hypothetical protein
MTNQSARRMTIQGVQVLDLSGRPYLEVAERIHVVHRLGRRFSVEGGEAHCIQGRWIYRAYVRVDDQRYLGDAEIVLAAPPDTPDGTHPLSCAQTSAIGRALLFAGYGDLRSVLARLGTPLEEGALPGGEEAEGEGEWCVIEGVRALLLDGTPYVPVEERLFHLYQSGAHLSMHEAQICELAGVWVYRIGLTVNDVPFWGEAEIFFDAAPGTPDYTHPLSCAQTSAVGNALAYAGFGDVRSLLTRLGKPIPEGVGRPVLASANAVLQARAQGAYQAQDLADRRIASPPRPLPASDLATAAQRARLAELCQRLGEAEPDASLSHREAEQLLARLEARQEELFQEAEAAVEREGQNQPVPRATGAAQTPAPSEGERRQAISRPVGQQEVRTLKERWRHTFRPTGTSTQQQMQWQAFKLRVCGSEVRDSALTREYYERLTAAIPSPVPRAQE